MAEGFVLMRNWWSLALRGLIAVLFGLVIFIWPYTTIGFLVILFGAFALAGGIFSILAALSLKGGWLLVLEGLFGVAVGLISFLWPSITAMAFLILIAVWAIITGGIQIILALRLHEAASSKWLLALTGIISIVFGLFLAARPGAGLRVITWLIGAYAVIIGVLIFGFALHLKGLQSEIG